MTIGKKKRIQKPWQSSFNQGYDEDQYKKYMNSVQNLRQNKGNYSFLKIQNQNSPWYSFDKDNEDRNFNNQVRVVRRNLYQAKNSNTASRLANNEFNNDKDESKNATQIVFIHKGMSPNHILVNDKNNKKKVVMVDDNDYKTVILDKIKSQNGDIDIKFLQHGQRGTSKGDITTDDISMSKVVDVSIEKAYKDESCKNITISNVQCYGNIRAVWENLVSKVEDLKYLKDKKFVIRIGDDKYPGWADNRNRSNYIKGASGAIYRRNVLEIEVDKDGKPRVLLNYVDVTKDFLNKCSFDELRKNHKNYESAEGIGSAIDPIRIKQPDQKYDDDYIAYMLRKIYVKDKTSIAKNIEEIRSKSTLLSDKARKIIFEKDSETKEGFKNIIKQLSGRSFEFLKSSRPGGSGRYFE